MHDHATRAAVVELTSSGINDCEVARITGVPRSTVREMRIGAEGPAGGRSLARGPACPRCWRPARRIELGRAAYAELLGLYLGDGHIVRVGRADRLRLFLDSGYPVIINDTEQILRAGFPQNKVRSWTEHGGSMTVFAVDSTHLRCLFPQHGPGLKHTRRIRLEPWQAAIGDREPWRLLRGLIRSDGCTFINRTGPYEYLSFNFTNRSRGIIRIFERACEVAGIDFRTNHWVARDIWDIRINRRASVARMVEHVGVKA